MTCFIGNPNDPNMQAALKSSKLFWGEDKYAMGYLTWYRKTAGGDRRGSAEEVGRMQAWKPHKPLVSVSV